MGLTSGSHGARMTLAARDADELPEAGELLAVEAIDRTGLVVTSEGAFVRVLRVTPANPLILSGDDREAVAAGFGRLLGRLRPGQSLQFYVDARPVRLDDVLAERARARSRRRPGRRRRATRPARDATALSRWRLYAAMEESLRRHADEQAAVELARLRRDPVRCRAARGARAVLRAGALARRRWSASSARTGARRARARRTSTRCARSSRRSGCRCASSTASEVFALLWARLNPTSADGGRRPAAERGRGPRRARRRRATASRRAQAALALRARLARSSVDLKRERHLRRGRARRRAGHLRRTRTAQQTAMGWLLGAMLTRQPYTLSVHVHALDRRRERQRIKLGYRRLFAINRGAEQRGRVPDFDRYAQEHEYEQLLAEMAGHERANLFEVSIYQALRAPGPAPDLAALGEAVDYCVEPIESAADCKVGRGEFRQRELWASTLPLGRDVARRVRKYATRNAADTVPLVGTGCGSPAGIPFAFTDPGRTLERLDPYDPEHANHTLLICGRSGSGKTMTANLLLARADRARRARLRDRPRRPLRAAHPAGRRARSRSSSAPTRSPYAINPWDVPDPRQRVAREDRLPALAAHADDGRRGPRQGRARAARRGDPRRLRRAPPRSRTSRRASRCCATSCSRWPTTTSATAPPSSPRSCATSPRG